MGLAIEDAGQPNIPWDTDGQILRSSMKTELKKHLGLGRIDIPRQWGETTGMEEQDNEHGVSGICLREIKNRRCTGESKRVGLTEWVDKQFLSDFEQ